MVSTVETTTMTVRAMGELLGLKKTDSYYLVNKNVFDTIVIAGKKRIVKASFEEWYARQDWYRKVNGEPPGAKLHSNMYSVADLQKMLELSQDSVLELIHREKLLTMTFGGKFWVPKVIFEDWYASQTRYRTLQDRERDRPAEESSMTIPEMGRLLGLDPKQAWKLYHDNRKVLQMIRIADRPRITKASFLEWLGGQEEYKIDSEQEELQAESESEKREIESEAAPSQDDSDQKRLTAQEAAEMLGVSIQWVYRSLKRNNTIGKKIGRTWYFIQVDIDSLTELLEEE
ncbi:MAG: helix-turn-helix domain-containing protein [Clostridia bacterium]|nr:helix-turn-helix domain-containing protein [Clostridia bacterium]